MDLLIDSGTILNFSMFERLDLEFLLPISTKNRGKRQTHSIVKVL